MQRPPRAVGGRSDSPRNRLDRVWRSPSGEQGRHPRQPCRRRGGCRRTSPPCAPPAIQSCPLGFLARFRSEEHTSELQSLMRISYAVFCLKKKNTTTITIQPPTESHTT